MISNIHDIAVRIGFAILRDEVLTLEYDAGTVEARGDELYDAWDAYDRMDPFTIYEGTKDDTL